MTTTDSTVLKALEGVVEESKSYFMFVHKSKYKDFTHFLKNLGFKNNKYSINGSYLIYELNIDENSYVKDRLDNCQPKFLKAAN